MMQKGVCVERHQGTPQGGPLSPLLSNLLLDDLDQELERRGHRFCRYADDCVPRRHGKEVIPEVPCCIRDEGGPLGTGVQAQVPNHLKLRWSKARVVSVQEKARENSSGEGQGDERKRTTDDVSKA